MRRPSKLPKYTEPNGRYYYYRRDGKRWAALPGLPWSPTFMGSYEAAQAVYEAACGSVGKDKLVPRSVGELTTLWLQTSAFRDLKPISQKALLRLVKWIQSEHGHRLVAEMRRRHVEEKLLTPWADRPSDHNRLLSLLRRLLAYAVRLGWITTNPVVEFKKKKLAGSYATWTEEQIAAYEKAHAIGTTERLAFDLLLWTAQRSADVRAMGRHQIQSGCIVVRQSKTGNPVDVPISSALAKSLATVPSDRMLFLLAENGKPFTPSTFSHFMTAATKAAGVEGVTPHGLRKAACRRLAEAGCSASEIQAISGHKSLRECERYVEAANRKTLAESASARRDAAMARVVPIEAGTKLPNPVRDLAVDQS